MSAQPVTQSALPAPPRIQSSPHASPRKYETVSAWEFMNRPPAPWAVRGVIPASGVVCIYSPPNVGKTFLALDLAAHLLAGAPWFGHHVKPRDVLYVGMEGVGGLSSRLKAMRAGCTFSEDQIDSMTVQQKFLMMVNESFSLMEPADVKALIESAKVLDRPAVIIDTLAQSTAGAEENSNTDMSTAMRAAVHIGASLGGPVIVLHHPTKGTEDPRGGGSLLGAIDVTMFIKKDESSGVRTWKSKKTRDGADDTSGSFKLVPEVVGLDMDGMEITSCFVRPVQPAGPVAREPTATDKVLCLIRELDPKNAGIAVKLITKAYGGGTKGSTRVNEALRKLEALGVLTRAGAVRQNTVKLTSGAGA